MNDIESSSVDTCWQLLVAASKCWCSSVEPGFLQSEPPPASGGRLRVGSVFNRRGCFRALLRGKDQEGGRAG